MPRGSRPGERRGGRQRGTPNKKTALKNAALAAAAADPNLSPLDFLLSLMRDPGLPPDLRIKMAQAAAPFVHAKAGDGRCGQTAVAAPELRVRVAQVAAPFVHGTEQERRRWRDRSAQSRPASVLVEQNDCEQPLGCGHAIGSVDQTIEQAKLGRTSANQTH